LFGVVAREEDEFLRCQMLPFLELGAQRRFEIFDGQLAHLSLAELGVYLRQFRRDFLAKVRRRTRFTWHQRLDLTRLRLCFRHALGEHG
jgi:hypothetical protein